MRKKLLFLAGMLTLCVQLAFAQTVEVSGKVTDDKGNPLQGVSVIERGAKSGTTTGASGTFSLSVKKGANLEISFIGFETKTIAVGAGGNINVKLSLSDNALNEVVVTGVGTATTKRKLAIDVGTLNSKDVAKSAIASVEQALQGKIAGASVQFTSGLPGSSAQIVLRGINDLGASSPMILVDGVEVNGGLTGLDLSTVERIEVVKGAAGGTLYGAQGASGVIQIFTKKGARGRKPQIDIRSQLSFDQIIRQNDITNNFHHFGTDASGFITRSGVRIAADVNGKWPDPVFSTAGLTGSALANVKNDKPYQEQTYDHISAAYRTALTHNTSLNISGGSEKADYAFGVSYLNQENVLYNGFKRINITSNLGFELFKGLTVRSITQFVNTNEDLLSGAGRFNLANSWQFVNFNFRGPEGYLVVRPKQENQLNPLSEREWRNRSQKQNRIIQSANVNYKFPKYLELDYKYGIEIWNTDLNDYYLNQRKAPQVSEAFWGGTPDGSITSRYNKFTYQNSVASAFLRFDFADDFNLNIPLKSTTQASYDWRNSQNRQYFARGANLPSYPPYNINVAQNKDAGSYDDEFTTFGFLINQTFDFGNLFGVSGGIRSDYSSEFGAGSQAFTFPRVTAYFHPSELLKLNWLTDWKVRGAYGEAGIQPGRYARQVILDAGTVGTGGVGLSVPSQARNPLLKVQRSKELEVGTDVIFKTSKGPWLSRVVFSGTYWKRTSEDIIQPADVPPSTGFQNTIDNLATLTSKGVDLSVDVDVAQMKNFVWNFGARLGAFEVNVDKISNGKEIVTGFFGLREGQGLGIFNAMYPLTSLDAVRPDGTPYIAGADKQFYEVVNNTLVDKRTNRVVMSDPSDTKVVGNAFPKFNASFINTLSYKNITLAFQIDWRQGNEIYNITRQWMYRDRLHADFDKPVTINGQSGAFVEYYNSLYNNVSPSSWFIENGSYVRLRDLSLTYTLGSKNLAKVKFLRAASVTFAGRNLLTITKYSGLDPESTNTNDAQGNAATGLGVINGVDYFGVPNLRSYQISISLGF